MRECVGGDGWGWGCVPFFTTMGLCFLGGGGVYSEKKNWAFFEAAEVFLMGGAVWGEYGGAGGGLFIALLTWHFGLESILDALALDFWLPASTPL